MDSECAEDSDAYNIALADMVTFRISQLNAELNTQALRMLKQGPGLTLVQWRVLVLLDAKGAISPTEIVRFVAIDKGQLSRNVKSMMESGLLKSEGREATNLTHLVSITPKGRKLFEAARPAMRARQLRLTANLSEEERQAFFRLLEKISLAARAD